LGSGSKWQNLVKYIRDLGVDALQRRAELGGNGAPQNQNRWCEPSRALRNAACIILFQMTNHSEHLVCVALLSLLVLASAGCVGRPCVVAPPSVTPPWPHDEVQLGVNASLGGRRLFPPDNPWNRDISQDPVDPNSANLIRSIGWDKSLHPDFGTFYKGAPVGIPYVVVSGTQRKVRVEFGRGRAESDPGPYPIPPGAPIEGGQHARGDRHVIVLDRDNWKLYELYAAYPQDGGKWWKAGSGAIFDLKTNRLRPAGWTSADAAGLPILAGLVRYDEVVERGEITHALRFTAKRTRRAYVPPATHYASFDTDPNLPPMGMRVRLRADYDISDFPPEAQVILGALKKYGMILADNGGDWFLSGVHDSRWNDAALNTLKRVRGRDFEVVLMKNIVVGRPPVR
jgi:hypothetical protein